jgi:hypothetical protein
MLIFDCTQDACDFFSKKIKGKNTSIVQPAAAAQALENESAADERIDRWQLHAITFGRTNVLAAMKVDTRYAMLFVGLKRNDVEGFLEQFTRRYIGSLLELAVNVRQQMPDRADLQRRIDAWDESLKPVHFFKRGDRSVQGHLNEVLGFAAYDAYEGRGLAVEYDDLVEFDASVNSMIRTVRGTDSFIPVQRELQQACPRLGMDMTEAQIDEGYSRLRSMRRGVEIEGED